MEGLTLIRAALPRVSVPGRALVVLVILRRLRLAAAVVCERKGIIGAVVTQ